MLKFLAWLVLFGFVLLGSGLWLGAYFFVAAFLSLALWTAWQFWLLFTYTPPK